MENTVNTAKNNPSDNEEFITISRKEYEDMKALNEQLKASYDELNMQINYLLEQIRNRNHNQFVSTNESTEALYQQLSLTFNEAEGYVSPSQFRETEVKGHKRKTHIFTDEKLPEGLDVEVIEHRLEGEDLICPECGSEMTEIGKTVRRTLVVVPAKVKIREEHFFTYACEKCKKDGTEVPIVKAERDAALIEGSFASPEAVAYFMNQKYVMGSPLYRLEQELKRDGVMLSRQTMSNWMMSCAYAYLEPIYLKLKEGLLREDILHRDETTLKVVKDHKDSNRKTGYMWLYRTGRYAEHPAVLYEYQPTRKGENAKEFLRGFKGYLHTDAYGGYRQLPPEVRISSCWAHRRRGFADALKSLPKDAPAVGRANEGLTYCNRLFEIEEETKDMSPEERKEYREKNSVPVLNEFREWIEANMGSIPPKSKLGGAISYVLNQWDYLKVFLEDGRLEISNNLAERSIKPFVIDRKNFLFSNTSNGAQGSAIIFSVIQTALEYGLNPYRYLKYIFETAPGMDLGIEEVIEKLLPWNAPEECRPRAKS